MNLLQTFEQRNIESISVNLDRPKGFRAGDTLKVHFEISTGNIQVFEGICIRRKSNGMGSSFTVRKVSAGQGVERTFPFYSPKVKKIEVIRLGKVRRAKLYYLRNLSGKAARIKALVTYHKGTSS